MCGNPFKKPKAQSVPEVATIIPTKPPSLADGTAAQLSAVSKRKNAAAGQKQTVLGGNLGAADTLSGKTLLGG